jgi:hypothetical protein
VTVDPTVGSCVDELDFSSSEVSVIQWKTFLY